VNNKLQGLVDKGEETLDSERVPRESRTILRFLDMRYDDQEHTVNVPIDFVVDESSKERIYKEFTRIYKQVWGYSIEGQPAAIVHLRVTTIGKVPKPKLRELEVGTGKPDTALKGSRQVFCFMDRKWIDYSVYERCRLLANDLVKGPALIEEPTSVTTIPQGFRCKVDKVGNLIITKKGG
jgi:N-methylhydantoinase A